ncbi:MAG: hypothetical protein KAG14_03970 [Mycoplasmataceae bacterium]|nr:hypothetical protein [Mycoplasmataceae bacterium]
MSHSIKMSIALNTDHEVKVCNDISKEINSFPKEYLNTFGEEISKVKNSISELKKFAEDTKNIFGDSDIGFMEYQLKLDSIMKRIKNIKSINLSNYITSVNGKEVKKINEVVAKNGVMATLAIQKLSEEGIDLNLSSLNKMIDSMRTDTAKTKDMIEENKRVENFIFDNDFSEELEEHFLALVEKSNSPQLLMDLYAMMGSMEIEEKRVSELYKDVSNILGSIGFSEQKSGNSIDGSGEVNKTTVYKNNLNKEFKMTFTARGIDYKMGNYDKHLCESDSENFMEILKKDFAVSNVRIMRNQSNSRPMLKVMKQTERGK